MVFLKLIQHRSLGVTMPCFLEHTVKEYCQGCEFIIRLLRAQEARLTDVLTASRQGPECFLLTITSGTLQSEFCGFRPRVLRRLQCDPEKCQVKLSSPRYSSGEARVVVQSVDPGHPGCSVGRMQEVHFPSSVS